MSQELKLELDKETAKGVYTNMAVITHTKDEFIIDFALAYPGQSPQVGSRIITSPSHAKAFLRSLEDNLRRFEARFGEVGENPKRPTDAQN
ncbi:DUF3467 domain-containing protein [soil metagenome]